MKAKPKRKRHRRVYLRWAGQKLRHPGETPGIKAWSVALGMFLAFTPFYGFQTLLGLLLAFMFRLNKIIVVIFVNLGTPYPIIPFVIYASFWLGSLFVSHPSAPALGENFSWDLLKENLIQYLAGSLVLSLAVAIPAWFITYALFLQRQKKRLQQQAEK